MFLTPSEEQQNIINHIKNEKNVVVDACAGSGKSTTILSLSTQMPNYKILQITYNSMLRFEIKEKIKINKITNIDVHTFHSLAVRYYLKNSHTDTGLRTILKNDLKSKINIPVFDLIVLDESQDMSFLYYQFVLKFIRDMNNKIQILILGDYMQGLYEFKGSDVRFLTYADVIWKNFCYLKNPEFEKCSLKTSYRITKPMADFVNKVMLGETRLVSFRDGEPVHYIRNTRKNIEKIVINQILNLLSNGVKPNDIFIIGASVKGVDSNIRKMENVLVEKNIPCHVPMFENEKLDERVIDGKIVFSTFHSVKGRQRDYVFIVGFDQNYFIHYARKLDNTKCPNTLYVGCTRAVKGLYLLEFDQYMTDRPLKFLKFGHYEMINSDFIKFKGIPRTVFYEEKIENQNKIKIQKKQETPTKLIKFIPDAVIEEISPIIDRMFSISKFDISNLKTVIKREKEDGEEDADVEIQLDIPIVIKTKNSLYEDVSDLNGIAIPVIYYEHICRKNQTIDLNKTPENKNVLRKMIDNTIAEIKENEHLYLKKIIKEELPEKCETINDYLFLANVYLSTQERLYFKLKQIEKDEYNWLSNEIIDDCKTILENVVQKTKKDYFPETEYMFLHHSMENEHTNIDKCLSLYFENNIRFRFTAIVDVVTDEEVWELKCVSKITMEHLLQVIIYAWLWKNIYPNCQKIFKILNIKNGEILVLQSSMEELTNIVVLILQGKYCSPVVMEDNEFINECHKNIAK